MSVMGTGRGVRGSIGHVSQRPFARHVSCVRSARVDDALEQAPDDLMADRIGRNLASSCCTGGTIAICERGQAEDQLASQPSQAWADDARRSRSGPTTSGPS
jgi:hypothetical protein